MNWFDKAGLTNFAKSALTTAQKTIDKALDIKEDTSTSSSSTEKKETDGFFEVFGLSSKVSQTLNQTFKTQTKSEETSMPSTSQEPSANAGFWTDTWGSFFEADKSLSEIQPSEATDTPLPDFLRPSPSNSGYSSVESAVSSQPVRSSLFPGNVQASSPAEEILMEKNSALPIISSKPCSIEISATHSPELTVVEKESDVVCDQTPLPVSSNVFVHQEQIDDDKNVQEIDDAVLDKTLTDSENDDNATVTSHDDALNRIEESEDFQGEDSFKLVPNEYDVVDINEKCLEGAFNENLISVSTDNEPSHFKDDIGESSELGNSKIASEETINTENSQSDNFLLPTESNNIETIHFSDSFHILDSCIINNVNDWVGNEGIHPLEDSAHESESTEEANSRNADTQSNSSKDESEVDVKECEIKSSGSGGSHEMSGSFVKCSIEEADAGSHRGQSPLSAAASEQSDGTKLESEQNTSGDEIETTTSSDIEILSTPNGENGDRNSTQNWVPRILRIRRSESPPSDSSKDNSTLIAHEGEISKSPHVSSHQRHHRKAFESSDVKQLIQQQEELQILLEAREKKALELSQENLKLHETMETLQNELAQAKTAEAKNNQIISSVTKECTQRLAQMEGQVLKVSKQRDLLRNQVDELQDEMVRRVRVTEMEEVIKVKDQQIKELMEEGEKLSKKELTHTTIIKKLRVKEEDLEHTIKTLKEKLDENSKEVERLRKSLGAKDEQEKKHIDAIRQLNTTVNKQEKEIINFKSRLEDSAEKELSQKKSLEGTFMELKELRHIIESKDAEIKKLTLSVKMAAKEKLREGIDQANKEKETLAIQIEDLRNSLKQREKHANKRESSLKQDIESLQLRLQESEDKNEKLTKSISTATRPVVRQLEVLQSRYNALMESSERAEKNLTDKLSDIQSKLTLASNRERLMNEKCLKMSEELSKLEKENTTLKQEKVKFVSEIDILKSRILFLEESTNSDIASVTKVKETFSIEVDKLKEEKVKLSQELQKYQEQINNDKQLIKNLQDELKCKDKLHSMEFHSQNSSANASLRSSVDSLNNWINEGVSEGKLLTPVSNYRMSVYDSLRNGCEASVLENLQSQLKQRDGEISHLQCEISKLEREKECITQELVHATTENDDLQKNFVNLTKFRKLYEELNQKHNKLLEMYGEEVEEKEELSEAIAMYKAQIKELLDRK